MKIPTRRFAKLEKTWEIFLDGETCVQREGKSAPKRKKHASSEKALEEYVMRISGKLWEGYVEVIGPGRPSPPMPEIAGADLPSQRARLAEVLAKANLAACVPRLEAVTKVGLALRLRKMDEADFEIGATRFGGHPDLPSQTAWPTYVEKATKRDPARAGQVRWRDVELRRLARK